ncbi:acetyl-CoA carboxylase biotin carboxyl carrier protein [Cryobacterium frigoriphilum]|uniref:Biotin carboxyl carrier protein of acetyl-CoA carboxylase n=1 Tax=Cryobacterium frigoriphilum TaxID=1259150 RepID=A0A4V3IQN1_9MICO|nr:biotin/lipoyl-containing protein [Cryobacterium frigoriphilum]TFD46948.1 acetyl-CoA carboxylase biotin carboxyl carrier protein [Cryobacterium frigoriphilum]
MTTSATPSWQDVLDLVTQLDDGSFESATVEFGDVSVRLGRSTEVVTPAASAAPALAVPVAAPALTTAPAAAVPVAIVPAAPVQNGTIVTAPIIGVFYRSPTPGAAPFIEAGATVSAETTIGIIEVMKLMNPVAAGSAGILSEYLVADNAQIEFGQPLAVIIENTPS